MIETSNKPFRQRALLALTILVLAGCASTPPAPVQDRSLGSRHSATSGNDRTPHGSYRVRKGDTLYSIAFRNGMDYRDVARANGIGPPYTIYVGQLIRLEEQRAEQRPVAATRPVPSRAPPRPQPSPQPAQKAPAPASPPAAVVVTKPSPAPSRAPEPQRSDSTSDSAIGWRWPAEGQLVARFVSGDQTRQGINIAGKSGDPVRATADGEVVYSGNGLIGYGELIIVKHSSTMLSAYGHNRRRLVQEGDRVKGGQQIAEMGSSSATRDMLHFEIRRNGKPVDPLGFLPKR
ncbi:MAG TPA: peptidoglycan DD-metalloendopeptidase family protein [Dokdonella sp.]|uniref:peptidoglycan DD-metalloendopeptidase family protein n=1 Tax=Dokdonella sp. TaxID=2291710 RepID=UPI002D7FF88D|nr:peptidoglycan DD-metalloendopeptidase family protein [Dokdonella sp.]HET9032985.1 peptidoglycan DD-metalloendopeptidase family protein [Dokdonella sp.]